MDISKEPAKVLEDYGAKPGESSFANNCLLARRLIEQGVRFVNLFDWGWDFHGTSTDNGITDGLTKKMAATDKPVAALIKDLKQRGLLSNITTKYDVRSATSHIGRNRDHLRATCLRNNFCFTCMLFCIQNLMRHLFLI
jgi:hypothetical protein